MPTKPTIFISYRRQPAADLARYIHHRLTTLRYDVFLDVETINGGRFANIIQHEIKGRDVFVVILTPETLQSEWVVREIKTALESNKPIIPLAAQGFSFATPLPDEIKELSDYDAVRWDNDFADPAFERLVKAIDPNYKVNARTTQRGIVVMAAALIVLAIILALFIPGILQPASVPTLTPTPSNTPFIPFNTTATRVVDFSVTQTEAILQRTADVLEQTSNAALVENTDIAETATTGALPSAMNTLDSPLIETVPTATFVLLSPITPISSTILPTSDVLSASLTPLPLTFMVTLQTGEEIQLTTLKIGRELLQLATIGYNSVLYGSSGIPLETGIAINFEYITRVEFGAPTSSARPVSINLIDGTVLKNNLAFFADTLVGESPLGDFEKSLQDVKLITVQRASEIHSLPSTLPPGKPATLIYLDDSSIQVSNPKFIFFSYSIGGGIYSPATCDDLLFDFLPTLQGLKINLSAIKEIDFLHTETASNSVQVNIMGHDGQVAPYQIAVTRFDGQLQSPCEQMGGWWVTGQIALGDFGIPISSVKKIIFDTVQ